MGVAVGLGEHGGDASRLVTVPHRGAARRPAAHIGLRRFQVAMDVTVACAARVPRLPYFPAMAAAGIVVDDEPVMHGERAYIRQRRKTELDYQGNEKGVRAIFLLHASIALILGLAASLAAAQDWPAKPLRIIVPFAPGGVADNSARVVAEPLAARLGQAVLVENRPGASGNIGTQAVAEAPADGYALLLGFDGTMVINPHVFARMPFDPLVDSAPVTKLGDATLILVAHPSLPAKTLAQMIELARAKPLAYGTSGTGGTPHLAGELLKLRTGAQLEHVPYKGGGQAIVDVVGGQIPLVFTAIATAQQYVRAGRLVGLGVPGAKRSPALPDVPTFEESGLGGFDVTSWVGIFAPAKIPSAVIAVLHIPNCHWVKSLLPTPHGHPALRHVARWPDIEKSVLQRMLLQNRALVVFVRRCTKAARRRPL